MTVYIRDESDFDSDSSMPGGFSGATHKFTEGTTTVHTKGPARLNTYRTQGLPILGSYHVLRTPGNGGNGSLSAQLDFWLSHLDSMVPWWRDVPFILQVDAEKWPYDSVSVGPLPVMHAEARATLDPGFFADILAARASTTIDFCTLLNDEIAHGWKICYASRGQYGDTLTGIPIDLWNAHYVGTYPGDTSSDFAPYSGRRPVGLQYTDTPFDRNGFPGTVQSMLSKMGGITLSNAQNILLQVTDGVNAGQIYFCDGMTRRPIDQSEADQIVNWSTNHGLYDLWQNPTTGAHVQTVSQVNLDTLGGMDPGTVTITSADLQAIVSALNAGLGGTVHAELAKLGITVVLGS